LKLRKLRENSELYAYNLARLYSYRSQPTDAKEAMKWLDHAVKVAKFNDIAEMKADPDLAAVRARQAGAFADLTRLAKGVQAIPARQPQHLNLTNQSAYAWTNVSVKVRGILANGQNTTLSYSDRLARINPQETKTLQDIFKDVGMVHITDVVVECDQNRKK